MSLPVIVVAESNQVASAWGTVLWDNSFSEIGRTPDAVPWPKLANALQLKFQSTTGCNLTEENLQHLCMNNSSSDSLSFWHVDRRSVLTNV